MNRGLENCLRIYEDANFYDEEFRDRQFDISFFVEIAQQVGSPVLELGCGSGRIGIPIANASIEIDGIDISQPMIDNGRLQARESACNNMQFHLGNFSNFDLNKSYKLIFCATNALQHLWEDEQISSCFESVRRNLAPTGIFLIDIFNPDSNKLSRTWEQVYVFKEMNTREHGTLVVSARSEFDPTNQILRFQLDYRRKLDDAQIKVKDIEMKCLFPDDISQFCMKHGFKIIEKYGNYDRTPITPNSPKQIIFCTPL